MEVFHLKKKKLTLTSLFWHYLVAVGISFVCILGMLASLFVWMLSAGLIFPANTAELQADKLEQLLVSGDLVPNEIPFYYRWICFDEAGQITAQSDFSQHRQDLLYEAVRTHTKVMSDFPFGQYHRFIRCADGTLCVVQYDFSIPYTVPWMRHYLPDFQLLLLLILMLAVVFSIIFWTKKYAHKLHNDATALQSATQAIMDRRLDIPLQYQTNVCEFEELLKAMDLLRSSLAASLHDQWNMEEQRTREIAALAHDLKTPLTVISGNSELLAEDALDEGQRKNVEAILRNAERMQSYLSQLRLVVAQQNQPVTRHTVELETLFAEWTSIGEELCAAKQIRFIAASTPQKSCNIEAENVTRAVQNLLDNAVRYTPQGGEVQLCASVKDSTLCISVKDSGPGFTKEAMARGCEAFYTEDQSRQSAGHMGMGLYNVQHIAHRHQGKVTISNTETGGMVTMQLQLTE